LTKETEPTLSGNGLCELGGRGKAGKDRASKSKNGRTRVNGLAGGVVNVPAEH